MTIAGAHVIRRRNQLEALNAAAGADTREHAESLLRGIDALTRKFAALGPVPLDVLSRYERILVAAHTSNQLRVSSDYTGRELLASEVDE
jgi:hypothetical protein